MLITQLAKDPLFYVMVVVAVMVSIVLHELAHGLAALWQGDDTPRRTGHMTFNPLVHMGGMSIAALFIVGIAWGQMPVTPARFRSRYGDALVSVAGPLSNLLIAVVALTALGLWLTRGPEPASPFGRNAQQLLHILGQFNLVLCMFNLFPVPPLDGARIVASFHRGYRQFIDDPSHQQVLFFGFIVVFLVAARLFVVADAIARNYFNWLALWG